MMSGKMSCAYQVSDFAQLGDQDEDAIRVGLQSNIHA